MANRDKTIYLTETPNRFEVKRGETVHIYVVHDEFENYDDGANQLFGLFHSFKRGPSILLGVSSYQEKLREEAYLCALNVVHDILTESDDETQVSEKLLAGRESKLKEICCGTDPINA